MRSMLDVKMRNAVCLLPSSASSPKWARSPTTKSRRPTLKQFLQSHQMVVSTKYPFLTPQQIKRKTIELWAMLRKDLASAPKTTKRSRSPKSTRARLSASKSPAMFSSPVTMTTRCQSGRRRCSLQPRALLQSPKATSLNVFSTFADRRSSKSGENAGHSTYDNAGHICEDATHPQSSILKSKTNQRKACYNRRVSFSPRSNPVDPLIFDDNVVIEPPLSIVGNDDDSDTERDYHLALLHEKTDMSNMSKVVTSRKSVQPNLDVYEMGDVDIDLQGSCTRKWISPCNRKTFQWENKSDSMVEDSRDELQKTSNSHCSAEENVQSHENATYSLRSCTGKGMALNVKQITGLYDSSQAKSKKSPAICKLPVVLQSGRPRGRPKKCKSAQLKPDAVTALPELSARRKSPRFNKSRNQKSNSKEQLSDQNNNDKVPLAAVSMEKLVASSLSSSLSNPPQGVPAEMCAGDVQVNSVLLSTIDTSPAVASSMQTPPAILKFRQEASRLQEDNQTAFSADIASASSPCVLETLTPGCEKDTCIADEFDTFDKVSTPFGANHSIANRKRCLSSEQVRSLTNFHAMFAGDEDDQDFFC